MTGRPADKSWLAILGGFALPLLMTGLAGCSDQTSNQDAPVTANLLAAVVVQHSPSYARESQQAQENFDAVAQAYRAAAVKPVPGEDVRRFAVQAEAAVRDKRFGDAARDYAQALAIAPWWPEGRYNRALILGGLGQYRQAIVEMKDYLALVPNAANARAVQDKIYEWEARPVLSSRCDQVVGVWNWPDGNIYGVAADGSIFGTSDKKQVFAVATWQCQDANAGYIKFAWTTGDSFTMVLSTDGKTLSTNGLLVNVHATLRLRP